jgi:hypothetical protein
MSERNGLPRADWNMPPGVSQGDIPGNEREDYSGWEESDVERSCVTCYQLVPTDEHGQCRKCFDEVQERGEPYQIIWTCDGCGAEGTEDVMDRHECETESQQAERENRND